MAEFVTAEEAAALINDGAWIGTSGDGLTAWPNEVAAALRKRFQKTGHPKNIGGIHAPGIGSFSVDEKGMTGLSLPGLLTKSIAAFIGTDPIMVEQVLDNEIISYMLPLGVMLQLYHEAGRGMPGMLSKVGLGTFVDPRLDGGKCNDKTKEEGEDIVKYIPDFMGEEWLWYKSLPIDFAFIGGTTADSNGNISCEKQPTNLAHLAMAQACKARGGKVIVQVSDIVEAGEINPHMVKIPGIYVDYIVKAERPDEVPMNMGRTYARGSYNPYFTGEKRIDLAELDANTEFPLNAKKVIARRAAQEVESGQSVDFGMGIPQMMMQVMGDKKIQVISETGVMGGVPGQGLDFGDHWDVESMTDHGDHFSYFDAGLLDVGCFGIGEADSDGNLNVSHLSGTIKGLGGFTNIATNAKKTIFMGTFTAGGLKEEVGDGKLTIVKEGKIRKFLNKVQKISYNAAEALKNGNENLYVTERAVFRYTEKGMELLEIAPGIDLQNDVLDQMDFRPLIPEGGPKLMDQDLFREDGQNTEN